MALLHEPGSIAQGNAFRVSIELDDKADLYDVMESIGFKGSLTAAQAARIVNEAALRTAEHVERELEQAVLKYNHDALAELLEEVRRG